MIAWLIWFNNYCWLLNKKKSYINYLFCFHIQDRFNGLVLLNIHNETQINLDEVIDMLAIKYPKRLKMLHIMDVDWKCDSPVKIANTFVKYMLFLFISQPRPLVFIWLIF